MRVTAIKCDACDRIGVPEANQRAPQGWYLLKVSQAGTTSLGTAVACSMSCIETAVQSLIFSAHSKDGDE